VQMQYTQWLGKNGQDLASYKAGSIKPITVDFRPRGFSNKPTKTTDHFLMVVEYELKP